MSSDTACVHHANPAYVRRATDIRWAALAQKYKSTYRQAWVSLCPHVCLMGLSWAAVHRFREGMWSLCLVPLLGLLFMRTFVVMTSRYDAA